MKKISLILVSIIAISTLCLSSAELSPDLQQKLTTSSSDELIPITIRLTAQL